MEEMTHENWLVPFFLEDIASSYIGFGGGIIILGIFWLAHFKYVGWSGLLGAALMYAFSLGIGVGFGEAGVVNDRSSAAIAGIWAPLFLSVIVKISGGYIHRMNQKKTDIDHFLD